MVAPFRVGRQDVPTDKIVNLLQLTSEVGNHFVWIRSLSGLLRQQVSLNHEYHICPRCLYTCKSDNLWEQHQELCQDKKAQLVELPTASCPRGYDKFRYLRNTGPHAAKVTEAECRLPFVIFGDIESTQETITSDDPSSAGSTALNVHRPCAIGYVVARYGILFTSVKCI